MKKKFLIGLLAVVMCFVLTGCGEEKINNDGSNQQHEQDENQQQGSDNTQVGEEVDRSSIKNYYEPMYMEMEKLRTVNFQGMDVVTLALNKEYK